MLEIWYESLPSGPIPSLFKWWPLGEKWPCGGVSGKPQKAFSPAVLVNLLEI